MAQTERSMTEIEALLPSGIPRANSAQDLRDAITSALGGYAGLLFANATTPAVMSAVGTSAVIVDVFDTVTAQSSDTNSKGTSASVANNQITPAATAGMYVVDFYASVKSSENAKLVTFTQYKSGSPGLAFCRHFFGNGADEVTVRMPVPVQEFLAGEDIEIRVQVDAGTTDLTFSACGFQVTRRG